MALLCHRIRLKPNSVPRVRAWAAELTRRGDEVMATLRDETVRIESAFLESGAAFMNEVVESREELELLIDFDRSRE